MESVDHGIHLLDSAGVPANKIVIGGAFYARTWENVADVNNGLYQSGKFKSFVPFRVFDKVLSKDSGYVFYDDPVSKATHAYNSSKKVFGTFDNPASIKEKTAYAYRKGLKGIMFWELSLDKPKGGMVDAIYEEKMSLKK